jgi:hypothetical protein
MNYYKNNKQSDYRLGYNSAKKMEKTPDILETYMSLNQKDKSQEWWQGWHDYYSDHPESECW